MICKQTLANIALARGEPEEDSGGAEEDRRGRGFPGAEEVAKDTEAHTKRAGGDDWAPAKERGEDRAYCEKYADGAGDPAAEQHRATLLYWIIARFVFRYLCVRVFAQNPLPLAVVYRHDRAYPVGGLV
jgi:hypothetical protein